jgi:hypothetical protein
MVKEVPRTYQTESFPVADPETTWRDFDFQLAPSRLRVAAEVVAEEIVGA